MAASTAEVQQEIAASPAPAARFAELSGERRREVFFSLPETVRESLVGDMGADQLHSFVRRLDPDEATDVLGLAEEATRTAVLDRLDRERREKVEYLLEFSPESAAGLMSLDYVTVRAGRSLGEVAERVRRHEERTGRFPAVFVTEGGALVGELPAGTLAMDDAGGDITEFVTGTPAVGHDATEEDVVEVFRANPESTVAVLDDDGTILGVIDAEDLLRAIEEEEGETLYEFTGVAGEESVLDGPLAKVRSRYRWLVVNLGTAFLAAGVVGAFEATIAAFTLLAVYMPVVAGMGGTPARSRWR